MELLEFGCVCCHGLGWLEQPVPEAFAPSVADFGFALVLAGTAGHEAQTAQLLDFLGCVKAGQVAHFRYDTGQNGAAYAGNLQQIFRAGQFVTFGTQHLLNFSQFLVEAGNLLGKPDNGCTRAIYAILQTHTLLGVTYDFLSPAVAAPAQLGRMPDFPDAVCANGFQVGGKWHRL